MEPLGQKQQRGTARHRVFQGAQIRFNGLNSVIDCVIRDTSDAGARLSVASSVGIPQTFDLALEGAPSRACRVVWRKPSQIGVEFL